MLTAKDFFENMDIELLNKQEECLISLQQVAGFESETGQLLEGVLNLMDAISDVYENEYENHNYEV